MTLQVENLAFKYPSSNLISFPNLKVDQGETLLILGNSGSGKTTLLHLMAGLLKPTSGNVTVLSTSLNKLSNKKLDQFRGQHLGIVFQKSYFLKGLTAQQNVEIAAMSAHQKSDQTYISDLFNTLGLSKKENNKTYQLSIGEQQRVNMIRALVNKPQLLLADEPTSALDDKNCFEMVKVLQEAASINNSALVIVTHDQRLKNIFKNIVTL